jgi:hypothetical protein
VKYRNRGYELLSLGLMFVPFLKFVGQGDQRTPPKGRVMEAQSSTGFAQGQ